MTDPIFSLQRIVPDEGQKTLHRTVSELADVIAAELAPRAIATVQRVSVEHGTFSPISAGSPYLECQARLMLRQLVLAPEDRRRVMLGLAGDHDYPAVDGRPQALLHGPTVRYLLGVEGVAPGIWRTVAYLQGEGFETCDSGDGAAVMEGALPVPHVHMRVKPEHLVAEADRLRARMRDVVLDDDALADVQFIASYDAADGSAVLSLVGFGDANLLPFRERYASRSAANAAVSAPPTPA